MSFFRGGGGMRPRGGRMSFHGGTRFGIAPLTRPDGFNLRGYSSFRGGHRGQRPINTNRGGFKTPGRGEVIRMGPSKPVAKKEEPKPEAKKVQSETKKEEKPEEKKTEAPKADEKEAEDSASLQVKEEPIEVVIATTPIKEEEIEETPKIELDQYNSELHVVLEENNMVGSIMRGPGFEFMWGGVRAMYGVSKGKVCFEVHLLENQIVNTPDEKTPNVARVGWSVDGSEYQLGEDKLSWGYGGTGKSSYESKFRDYGKQYGAGDVVTCYVDLDATPKAFFYMVNGQYLGVAFRFTDELGGKAVYPHVAVKNMKFKVNFGKQPPKYPLTNGFRMLQTLAADELETPPPGPIKPGEAEMLMMVGLPACGKSFWCEKYAGEKTDKKYYILGTNTIIDRMKVTNLLRKRNYHGRWEELIKRASAVLNKLFEVAKKRPKNYILDQTNVYFTARRRKMESFRGYKRIAAVLVNKPDVLEWRTEKQKKAEGKIVPEEAIMEMKRNFTLPEVGPSFDEVWYLEEKLPGARELVEGYRAEGDQYKKSGAKRAFSGKEDTSNQVNKDKRPRVEQQQPPNRGFQSAASEPVRPNLMEINTNIQPRSAERDRPPVAPRSLERDRPPVAPRSVERDRLPVAPRPAERDRPPVAPRSVERDRPPVAPRSEERDRPPVAQDDRRRPPIKVEDRGRPPSKVEDRDRPLRNESNNSMKKDEKRDIKKEDVRDRSGSRDSRDTRGDRRNEKERPPPRKDDRRPLQDHDNRRETPRGLRRDEFRSPASRGSARGGGFASRNAGREELRNTASRGPLKDELRSPVSRELPRDDFRSPNYRGPPRDNFRNPPNREDNKGADRNQHEPMPTRADQTGSFKDDHQVRSDVRDDNRGLSRDGQEPYRDDRRGVQKEDLREPPREEGRRLPQRDEHQIRDGRDRKTLDDARNSASEFNRSQDPSSRGGFGKNDTAAFPERNYPSQSGDRKNEFDQVPRDEFHSVPRIGDSSSEKYQSYPHSMARPEPTLRYDADRSLKDPIKRDSDGHDFGSRDLSQHNTDQRGRAHADPHIGPPRFDTRPMEQSRVSLNKQEPSRDPYIKPDPEYERIRQDPPVRPPVPDRRAAPDRREDYYDIPRDNPRNDLRRNQDPSSYFDRADQGKLNRDQPDSRYDPPPRGAYPDQSRPVINQAASEFGPRRNEYDQINYDNRVSLDDRSRLDQGRSIGERPYLDHDKAGRPVGYDQKIPDQYDRNPSQRYGSDRFDSLARPLDNQYNRDRGSVPEHGSRSGSGASNQQPDLLRKHDSGSAHAERPLDRPSSALHQPYNQYKGESTSRPDSYKETSRYREAERFYQQPSHQSNIPSVYGDQPRRDAPYGAPLSAASASHYGSNESYQSSGNKQVGGYEHDPSHPYAAGMATTTSSSGSNLGYLYTTNTSQTYGKPDDRMSSSYQTQMTTSTANYSRQGYTSTSLPTQNHGSDQQTYQSSSGNSSNHQSYGRSFESASQVAPPPQMPENPSAMGGDRSQSYEQQQEDYQKAYSQWYANYAQAFAQLTQQQPPK